MTIPDLIAALERGDTGRELDCAIARAIGWTDAYVEPAPSAKVLAGKSPRGVEIWAHDVAHFTTSLDACAAATPEGWRLIRMQFGTDEWEVVLVHDDGRDALGYAPGAAAAWAAAILQAKGGEP